MSLEVGEPRVAVNRASLLGEGPVWDTLRQLLYWVDIERGIIHHYSPAEGVTHDLKLGEPVSAVALCGGYSVVAAFRHTVAEIDIRTGRCLRKTAIESELAENRCNDGKCDPLGRFWFGTTSTTGRRQSAALYSIDSDFAIRQKLNGVSVSNGLVWSLDRTRFYFIDTPCRRIDLFDFDVESGSLFNRRVLTEIPAELGFPDGMTIDVEGRLWVAMYGGGGVTVWDSADGSLLHRIRVPATYVTSVTFGGEDLSQLYVTSAVSRNELTENPVGIHDGALFVVATNTRGVPSVRFDCGCS